MSRGGDGPLPVASGSGDGAVPTPADSLAKRAIYYPLSRVAEGVEKGREKGANGGVLAVGDDDDVGMDCGTAGDGALADGGQRRAESGSARRK